MSMQLSTDWPKIGARVTAEPLGSQLPLASFLAAARLDRKILPEHLGKLGASNVN